MQRQVSEKKGPQISLETKQQATLSNAAKRRSKLVMEPPKNSSWVYSVCGIACCFGCKNCPRVLRWIAAAWNRTGSRRRCRPVWDGLILAGQSSKTTEFFMVRMELISRGTVWTVSDGSRDLVDKELENDFRHQIANPAHDCWSLSNSMMRAGVGSFRLIVVFQHGCRLWW